MRNATGPMTPALARLVQQFFTDYLVAQRALSPCTVARYRDAMMLFLAFAARTLGKEPSALRLFDSQPKLILVFLDHLERERHNAVRSRNLRLTALRAFLKFAGRCDVSALHIVERALAVPMKRSDRPMLGYLTREEMLAVLGQPGSGWASQRDHLLLAVLYKHAPDEQRWFRLRATAMASGLVLVRETSMARVGEQQPRDDGARELPSTALPCRALKLSILNAYV